MADVDLAFWRALRAADFALPAEHSLPDLTDTLLGYLGSPDAELRDAIAYETLATWMARGRYTAGELRAIGAGLLPRLTRAIEQPGTDAVFERAFAMLVLAELLHTDATTPSLDDATFRRWLDAGLDAFARERDLRGYVPGRGWAHATAHAADLCRAAAGNPRADAADLRRILAAIAGKLTTPTTHVFIHQEDERLAAAVLAALRRSLLDSADVRDWLGGLSALTYAFDTGWYRDERDAVARHNVSTFLRSLALQLRFGHDLPGNAAELAGAVEEALRAMDSYFYALRAASA